VLATDFDADVATLLAEQRPWAGARARLLLAHAHFASGDLERAERIALSAQQQRPDDGLTHLVLASLVLRRGGYVGTLAPLAAKAHLDAVTLSASSPVLSILDFAILDGLRLALQGDMAAARRLLEGFVTPRFLADRGFPRLVDDEQVRRALALL